MRAKLSQNGKTRSASAKSGRRRISHAKNVPTRPSAPAPPHVSPKKLASKRKKARARAQKARKSLTPRLGSREFKALQADWYRRLKDEGFRDLENLDSKGNDRADYRLHGRSLTQIARLYDSAVERHYARLRNFATHCPSFGSNWDRFVLKRYAEGISYQQICNEYEAETGIRRGKYSVHHSAKRIDAAAIAWNKRDPLGLDWDPDF
jgi:hypothetical protein